MKKKFTFFITLLLATLMCVGAFCACAPPAREYHPAFTVSFNDNYNGEFAKKEVGVGEKVALPDDPQRPGYKFVGWYLSDDEITAQAFDPSAPVTENMTVYAKWQKKEGVSIVTLVYNDYRSQNAAFEVPSGSAFARPAAPVFDENEMYAFVDWYADEELTQAYDFAAAVSADTTLYAGWKQQKAYVRFDYNYTACPAPTKTVVELGKTAKLPEAPTRDRYEFIGWFDAQVGGNEFDVTRPIDAAVTLYAHWLRSEFTVSFDPNGGTLAENIEKDYVVKRNASIASIAETVRKGLTFTGHDFAGWYTKKTDPDADEPLPEDKRADLSQVSADMTLYAGWTLQVYDVKFDYNYTNAPAAPETQKVKYGRLIEDPGTPQRSGYLFGGWFLTPGGGEQFTLDTPVTGAMTLYAKWIEDTGTHEKVTVTYYYNIGAGNVKYAEKAVNFNATADSDAPDDPVVTDYFFNGWYEDAALTKAFNMKKNLTESTSVYGKLLKKHTFEAEAIDFAGKRGQGTSTNSVEEGMIMDGSFVEGGDVSNGYFVRELYYSGASLEFYIHSDREVTDAVLSLRVSSESYEFFTIKEKNGVKYNYLSDTEFKIVVNGDWDANDEPLSWLKYGGLYMPMANLIDREDLAQHKTPFEDCLIVRDLHLIEGDNIISLYVDNNNNHGGTFHAEAPIIDCMYIYSSAELGMKDHEYYKRPGVNRG